MSAVDVLAEYDARLLKLQEQAAHFKTMGQYNAENRVHNEITGVVQARAAVAELMEAAGTYARRYAMDEASIDGDLHTGCSRQQHLDAVALFAALARVGGGK